MGLAATTLGALTAADLLLPATSTDRPASRIDHVLPMLNLPVLAALQVAAAAVWSTTPLSPVASVVFVAAFGLFACTWGSNAAHELIHRRGAARTVGRALLAVVGHPTFAVEHVRGHHVHVGTPEDGAFAPRGSTAWAVVPRAMVANVAFAFRDEARRLRAAGRSPWVADNIALRWTATSVAWAAALGVALGPWAVVFWTLQAVAAIASMELINYVEHYGLERARRPDGGYERVSAAHSWSSPSAATNAVFYNVQLHADHHAHPGRAWTTLRLGDGPVQPLPTPLMAAVALVPPAWFALMDRRPR